MNMKKMGLMGSCGLLVALITCAMTLNTQANMLIYPAKSQSPQQQQKDEYECHIWAVKQTGFDPTKAQAPPQQDAAKKKGR